MKTLITLILTATLLLSCSKKESNKPSITVYAAASTLEFTQDIAKAFEKKTGIKVILNTASSGILARQIEAGAKVDIFISASEKWADYLTSKELVTTNNVCSPMTNSLVLIAPKVDDTTSTVVTPDNILTTLHGGRLSVGDPAHVPVGKYAVEALVTLGLYDTLEEYLLPAQNTRAALKNVEINECNLGIVYLTDAKKSKKVSIVYAFSDSLHNPINYAAAIIDSTNSGATSFYDFFNSPTADSLMTVYGFVKNKG